MKTRNRFLIACILAFATPGLLHADEPLFARHITPTLYKLGCSAGECHGAFAGKGGFRLSLFAGDAQADHDNVVGPLGRRVNVLDPDQSLLLLKATGAVPHGGGVKLPPGGKEYQLLKTWIAGGARHDAKKEPRVLSIQVQPAAFTISSSKGTKAVKVLAKLSDGSQEDVTAFTRFDSLDPSIAEVDRLGQVTGLRGGDVAILAFYGGQVGFAHALVPGTLPAGMTFPKEDLKDKIDVLLSKRQQALNIIPSPLCSDVEFLRRVYLDVIGALPTPDEVKSFLADQSADKRAKVIARLLDHPHHSSLWAGKLCDMVGADDRFLGNNVYQFHDWFRNKLEKNTPWDQLAYGVICSTAGDERTPEAIQEFQKKEAEAKKNKTPPDPNVKPWHTGYATRKTLDVFYNNLINMQELPNKKRILDSKQIALRVAHTFLGVRLECAQCHKHPHDRWTQADFFGFAAAFTYVEFGADPELKTKKVNLSGTHVSANPVETFTDPHTGEPIGPHILGGKAITMKPGADPRKEVWQWLVAPDNPYFAHAIVNRVWAHYLGRGLVDPPDDFSAANPPAHPEVLDELVKDFIQHKYDLRHLHQRILNTVAYQRSWKTNVTNSKDSRNFSHFNLRRLTAEQVVDALAQITDTPVKFAKRYGDTRPGARAVELALSRAGGADAYVLEIFGKPLRIQNCDCERSSDISLSQVLYLYNDDQLLAKIADPKGRLQKLVADTKDDKKLIEELYLWTLTRYPTEAEMTKTLAYLKTVPARLEAYQDIVWSLLNRKEFIVSH